MMQLAFTAPAPPEQLLDLDAALIHSVTPSGGAYSCSLVVPRGDFGDLRDALGQRGIAVIADTPKFIFAPDNNRAFERLSGALG